MADADLTITILREIQRRLGSLEETTQKRFGALEKKFDTFDERLELTNERLSIVERGVTFCAAQINVMRRHMGIEDKKTDAEILDLQARVAKLEDLVIKP